MNKFIVDNDAYELLEQWRLSNIDLIRQSIKEEVWYFEKFEVQYQIKGFSAKAYCEVHHRFFEIKLYSDIGRIVTAKIEPSDVPGEDIRMRINQRDDHISSEKEADHIVRNMVLNSLTINALLIFGNLVEPSERQISTRSVSYEKDRTFVFKPYKDTCYAISAGSHRSPDGVFPVRGHFRRYKDGKVVWIEGYFKGV